MTEKSFFEIVKNYEKQEGYLHGNCLVVNTETTSVAEKIFIDTIQTFFFQ